jgi:glycosyltransferase involved in cell wall biosynthesis
MLSKVAELNVKSVKIVDKLLSRQEVAELLGQADALILPLVEYEKPYRGMSSKLYEYQAVGKPIICCSRGLPSVYVKETDSGLAVYPGAHEALAKAVIGLKENPELARIMGENGRKYVESEASVEAVGLKMKEILEALVPRISKN